MQPLKFPEPIEAAIDHHIRGAIRDHQRGMHTMPSRSLLNLTARAEECQFHQENGQSSAPLPICNSHSGAPYRAARLISSTDAGFSNADVSPSFSPRYAARTIRRITFAFRVFGMSATKTRNAKVMRRIVRAAYLGEKLG